MKPNIPRDTNSKDDAFHRVLMSHFGHVPAEETIIEGMDIATLRRIAYHMQESGRMQQMVKPRLQLK